MNWTAQEKEDVWGFLVSTGNELLGIDWSIAARGPEGQRPCFSTAPRLLLAGHSRCKLI